MAERTRKPKKQSTQKTQDAHEAQEPKVDYTLPSKDKLPPEVADLMQLSFAEIDKLPEAQKQLVYAEVGRQAAEAAASAGATFDRINSVFDASRRAVSVIVSQFTEQWEASQRGIKAIVEQLDIGKVGKALQEMADAGTVLQPYVDRIYRADPARWEHAKLSDIYAAAAKAAREDGQDVPPLWFEEQEDFPFDLQRFGEAEQQEATKEESSLTPAELLGTLKTIQAINPTSHVMPNNPLMNVLTHKPAINTGPFDLLVSNEQDKRKELTNYTIIAYDPGDSGITITDPKLSEYERQVSDAAISLWVEAKQRNVPPVFTVDMIYRSMPGGGDRPQPAQRAAIIRTMEKLRRLHIYMDATEEMQKRGKAGADGMCVMDEFYFNFTRIRCKARNSRQSVIAYKMEGAPIMLIYSQMTGQLLTIPAKYLEMRKVKDGHITAESLTVTMGRQGMVGYMQRRIAVMKHDEESARAALQQNERRRKKDPGIKEKPLEAFRKQSRVILFDTIFEEAGTTTKSGTQAKENRDFCFEVLKGWQIRGFIKGYTEKREGKKITGMTISL